MANNLRAIRQFLKLTQPALAERMGTTKNQLIKLEGGDRRLTQDWIETASRATGIPVHLFVKEDLSEDDLAPGTTEREHRAETSDRLLLSDAPQKGGRPDLAIRGIALGGKEGDGDFELNGSALDYIARPAGLINRPKAYAVILRNTSMEPVYKHGWPIFVDEDGRKPVEGEDVLVELHGDDERERGPAFIKTLIARRGGQVVLSQYNPPPPELRFPLERVKQILRVIPYPEAMGLSV